MIPGTNAAGLPVSSNPRTRRRPLIAGVDTRHPWPLIGTALPPAPQAPAPAAFVPDTETPDAAGITPLMAEVERILTRLAASAAPMPNNPVLGELCGGRNRQSAQRALERLVMVGRIRVERRGSERRVVVLATGQRTAFGEARPGHAPWSARARGTPAPTRRARKPQSPPLAAALPPVAARPPVSTAPASTCQWPLWADGERATHKYCDAPSAGGRNWCATHIACCYDSSAVARVRTALARRGVVTERLRVR